MKVTKLTVRQLCTLALLISVTVVLSYVSGNLRIGNISKLSVSFISVYVSAALFGAFWGGFVGITADFISFLVNPVGAYIWQFGALEFFYGFLYGMFFGRKRREKNIKKGKKFMAVLLCVLIQFFLNLFLKTYVLEKLGFMPSDAFWVCVGTRLITCSVMALIQFAAIYVAEIKYIGGLYKLSE